MWREGGQDVQKSALIIRVGPDLFFFAGCRMPDVFHKICRMPDIRPDIRQLPDAGLPDIRQLPDAGLPDFLPKKIETFRRSSSSFLYMILGILFTCFIVCGSKCHFKA